MSAYEIPNLRYSLEAGADVARRRFVKAAAGDKAVQCGAGEATIGVSYNDPKSGEVLEIVDGIVIVEAGAAVAVNAAVQSDANGKAITKAAGIGVAIALTAATAAGQLIAVKTPANT